MSWQPSIALGSILSPQWPSMIWHWKFIWYFPHWSSSDWIKCSVIIISVQKYFASEKEILMERKENTALWSIKVNINKQSESNLAKYSNFQIFSHCSKFAVSNFENDLECHFLLNIDLFLFRRKVRIKDQSSCSWCQGTWLVLKKTSPPPLWFDLLKWVERENRFETKLSNVGNPNKTSQELRMLSSVTIDCQITMID